MVSKGLFFNFLASDGIGNARHNCGLFERLLNAGQLGIDLAFFCAFVGSAFSVQLSI